jgi:hypothetical protein
MIIDKEYSLKPFGSGTSCIDCINGECIRNISMEDCKEICEKSNWCGAGIHVDFKNKSIPNYCLPLNTIDYKNRPITTSLISTEKNGTYLSREEGVDITFFRDNNMFPSMNETYNQLKSDLVFNYDIINFQIDGFVLESFLPYKYNFVKESDMITDFYIIIKGFDFSTGEVTRIHNNDVVYFFYKETSLVLTYNHTDKKFLWGNFTEDKTDQSNVFYIETIKNTEYVNYISSNSKVNIYTVYNGKKYYIIKTKENKLGMSLTEPNKEFYIINDIKMNNISNIPNKKLIKDRVDYMNKNMKVYLDTYFPDKRQKIEKKSFHIFSPFHIILTIIIIVTILSIIFK